MKKLIYLMIAKLLVVALLVGAVVITIKAPSIKHEVEQPIEEVAPIAVEPVATPKPEITHLVEISEPVIVKPEKEVEVDEEEEIVEPETKTESVENEVEKVEELPVDPTELELLACVIYQEAGGDDCCDDCRRRVADVVLNRMADDRFPSTMLEVLTERRQYGRFHWTGVVWPDRAYTDGERPAVERAYQIAEEVLRGEHSELYGQGYIWQAEFMQGTDIVSCYNCGIYFGR